MRDARLETELDPERRRTRRAAEMGAALEVLSGPVLLAGEAAAIVHMSRRTYASSVRPWRIDTLEAWSEGKVT